MPMIFGNGLTWDKEMYYMKLQFLTMAIVYTSGILCNLCIMIVLLWKGERSVVNKLLIILAVWDTFFLVCLLAEGLTAWYETGYWIIIKDPGVEIACNNYNHFIVDSYTSTVELCTQRTYWFSTAIIIMFPTKASYTLFTLARMFQLCSVYQTVIIAMFRFISIVLPFKASSLCTGNRAMIATVLCCMMCVIVHVPWFVFIPDVDEPFKHDSISKYIHWTYFFHGYNVIFYNVLLFFALPFITLLILNIVMLRELWHSSSAQTNDAAETENKAVTKVVVVIVTVFLVTYIVKPLHIVDIFYFKGKIINFLTGNSSTGLNIIGSLIYVIPTLNSVVNIFIYFLLRKSFRAQFLSIFIKCRNQRNSDSVELAEL